MHTFPDKDAGETVTLTFDFTSELGTETILSVTSAIQLIAGADPGVAAMLNGLPQIASGSKIVMQSVQAGLTGNVYRVTCAATTARQVLKLAGALKITAAQ